MLGTLRVLWLQPALGMRYAELAEMPVMLTVIWFAAKHVVHHTGQMHARTFYLACGTLALLLLLAAEFSLAYVLNKQSPIAFVLSRDPVSGSAYAVSLLLFALMPWWLWRQQNARR